MKTIKCLLAIITACMFMVGATAAETTPPDREPASGGEDAIRADWSLYSYGIYYKRLAGENMSAPVKTEYLRKAVNYFEQAAVSGKSLDRIYFQIAECHYMGFDYPKALEYAGKAISVNRGFFPPYQRIYTIYVILRNNPKAAEILEDYIRVNPDSINVQFTLAMHYYKKMKDMDRAEKAFNQVIKISSRTANEDYYMENSYYNLGYILYGKGRPDEALSCFIRVISIDPENYNAVYLAAFINMESFNLSEAEKYAEIYLSRFPENEKMNLVMGKIRYLQGRSGATAYLRNSTRAGTLDTVLAQGLYHEILREDEKAEQLLRNAMRYFPEDACLHLALAGIAARKKDFSSAFNEYLTAGIVFYKNRAYEQSRVCFSEALKINSRVPGVYYYLGRVYEEKNNLLLAIINYKSANSLKPDADMLLHIGYLYGVKKDYGKAVKCFDQVAEKDPKNSKPYFFKGLISIWREEYPAAESNIKKAISLNDKNETYYFYLAVVMEKRKKLSEAIDSLEKAIMHNPQSARSYNFLGYLFADNNMEIDRSFTLINKALELEPGNGAYIDSLGWAYYRKGRFETALEKLLEAERILKKTNTPDAVVYDHIGDTYKKLGKPREAVKYWNKSLDLEKNERIRNKILENNNDK